MEEKKSVFSITIMRIFIAGLCCFLWGSAAPVIKYSYSIMTVEGIPSQLVFAGLRFILAGVFILIFYFIKEKSIILPNRGNLKAILIISLFQTIGQYAFFYMALSNTTGVKAAIFSGTVSFFSIIAACLIYRMEKFKFSKILACLLGFAGIILVNLNGIGKESISFKLNGEGFLLLANIFNAFGVIYMKKYSKNESPIFLTAYQFFIGGIVLLLIGKFFNGNIEGISYSSLPILIYLGLLSAIAYTLWSMLLKYNPISKVTVFLFLIPIFGTILSIIILHEKSEGGIITLLSLILVSSGIYLSSKEKQ